MKQKALGGDCKRVEEIESVTGMKITKGFINQDGDKDMFNPKSKL